MRIPSEASPARSLGRPESRGHRPLGQARHQGLGKQAGEAVIALGPQVNVLKEQVCARRALWILPLEFRSGIHQQHPGRGSGSGHFAGDGHDTGIGTESEGVQITSRFEVDGSADRITGIESGETQLKPALGMAWGQGHSLDPAFHGTRPVTGSVLGSPPLGEVFPLSKDLGRPRQRQRSERRTIRQVHRHRPQEHLGPGLHPEAHQIGEVAPVRFAHDFQPRVLRGQMVLGKGFETGPSRC